MTRLFSFNNNRSHDIKDRGWPSVLLVFLLSSSLECFQRAFLIISTSNSSSYVVIYSSCIVDRICKREFHSLRLNRGTRSVYDHDLLQRSGSLPESKMLSCAAVCNDVCIYPSMSKCIIGRSMRMDGWILIIFYPVYSS